MENLKIKYLKHSRKILHEFGNITEWINFLRTYQVVTVKELSDLIVSIIKKYKNRHFITNFVLAIQGLKFLNIMRERLDINKLKEQAEILLFIMAHSDFDKKSEFAKKLYEKAIEVARNFSPPEMKEILKIWDFLNIISKKLNIDCKPYTDQILKRFIEVFDISSISDNIKEFLYFIENAPKSFSDALLILSKDKIRGLNIAHLLPLKNPILKDFIEKLKRTQKVYYEVEIQKSYFNMEITPYELPIITLKRGIDENTEIDIFMQIDTIDMPGKKIKNRYQAKIYVHEIVMIQMEGDQKSCDYKIYKKNYDLVPRLIGAALTTHKNNLYKNILKLYVENFIQIDYLDTDLIINSVQNLLLELEKMNRSHDFLPIITNKSLGINSNNKIMFVDFSFVIDESICIIGTEEIKVNIDALKNKFTGLVNIINLNNYGGNVNIETLQCNSLGVLLKRFALGYSKKLKSEKDLSHEFLSLIRRFENITSTFSDIYPCLGSRDTESISISNF